MPFAPEPAEPPVATDPPRLVVPPGLVDPPEALEPPEPVELPIVRLPPAGVAPAAAVLPPVMPAKPVTSMRPPAPSSASEPSEAQPKQLSSNQRAAEPRLAFSGPPCAVRAMQPLEIKRFIGVRSAQQSHGYDRVSPRSGQWASSAEFYEPASTCSALLDAISACHRVLGAPTWADSHALTLRRDCPFLLQQGQEHPVDA